MTKVSIIILSWNGKDNTLDCLKSVNQLSVAGFQLSVCVVDNGSSDGSADAFKKVKSARNLRIIENKKNLGYTGGNNVGIKQALKDGTDFIVILNNDTILGKNSISGMLKTFDEYPNAGIVSPKIYFAPGFEFHKDKYKKGDRGKVFWYAGGNIDWDNVYASHRGVDEVDHGQYDEVHEIDYASGCCMMIPSVVLKKIGTFDDDYFLYWEDADLSTRAKRAGYKVLYTPKAHLWHKNAGSSNVGGKLHDYYLTRNRLLFGGKFANLRARFALARESFKFIVGGRVWQRRGVIDYYFGNFGKGSFNE